MAKLIGAQRKILQAILDLPRDAAGYVTDSQIAQTTQIAISDVRDWIETLEGDGYVEVARAGGGLNALITAKGRLASVPTPDRTKTWPQPIENAPSSVGQRRDLPSVISETTPMMGIAADTQNAPHRKAGKLLFLLIEDDHLQAEHTENLLRAEFKNIDVIVLTSETSFMESFSRLAESSPDFVILDAMLRWSDPIIPTSRSGSDEWSKYSLPEAEDGREPSQAGLRCLELIRNDPRTSSVPVVIQSVLDRHDVLGKSIAFPNTMYCQKTEDDRKLVRIIRSMLTARNRPASQQYNNSVFLAHGAQGGIRDATARFLDKIGLRTIILDEQPNRGMTHTEKLIQSSGVFAAIIILSGDDQGSSWGESKQRLAKRAGQNVIFQLGYFLGKLGPKRVLALHEKGVELPSDGHGVIYIPLDPHDAWRTLLAVELRSMGLPVDLNGIR